MNYCEEGKASTTCKKCSCAIIERGIVIGCNKNDDAEPLIQQNCSSESITEAQF